MGVKTNIPYLQQILDSPSFQGGQIDTQFLDRRCPPAEEERSSELLAVVVAATVLAHRQKQHQRRAPAVVVRNTSQADDWKRIGRWMGMQR